MKKLATIGFLILMISGYGKSQNTKNYVPVNMYMLNPLLVNPAYSGGRESMSFTTMLGANWVDIPNAQVKNIEAAGRMGSLTADFPLSDKNAVGITVMQNKFGVNKNLSLYGHYAYRIITGAGKLSFGLRGGFNSYNRDLSLASFRDPGDPVESYDYSQIYPNFGAGVYWYSNDYYVGISVPDFFFPPLGSENFDANPKNYAYTLMAGYLFRISEDFKIKPSTMLTYSLNAPLVYQANLSFVMFQDRIWLGMGYKSTGVVGLFEIQIKNSFRLGYAFEYPTGGISLYAPAGSHEILLRFDTSFKLRTVSPAYFW